MRCILIFICFVVHAILFSSISMAQVPELKKLTGNKLEGQLIPMQKKTKWGYVNEKSQFIIKPIFDNAFTFKNSVAKVKYGQKWGLLKRDGTFKKPPIFQELIDIEENLLLVKVDNKYGLLNSNGDYYLFQPIFDNMPKFNKCGIAFVKINSLWGIVKKDGSYITQPKYTSVKEISEGRFIVYDGKKYAYLRPDGSNLTLNIFDSASDFFKGYAQVSYNNGTAQIDETGKITIQVCYRLEKSVPIEGTNQSYFYETHFYVYPKVTLEEELNMYRTDFDNAIKTLKCKLHEIITIKRDNKIGYLICSGKFLVEPIFDELTKPDKQGFILGRKDKEWYVINRDGGILYSSSSNKSLNNEQRRLLKTAIFTRPDHEDLDKKFPRLKNKLGGYWSINFDFCDWLGGGNNQIFNASISKTNFVFEEKLNGNIYTNNCLFSKQVYYPNTNQYVKITNAYRAIDEGKVIWIESSTGTTKIINQESLFREALGLKNKNNLTFENRINDFILLKNGNIVIDFSVFSKSVIGQIKLPDKYVNVMGQTLKITGATIDNTISNKQRYILIIGDNDYHILNIQAVPDNAAFIASSYGGFYFYQKNSLNPIFKLDNDGKLLWKYASDEGETIKFFEETAENIILVGSSKKSGYVGYNNPMMIVVRKTDNFIINKEIETFKGTYSKVLADVDGYYLWCTPEDRNLGVIKTFKPMIADKRESYTSANYQYNVQQADSLYLVLKSFFHNVPLTKEDKYIIMGNEYHDKGDLENAIKCFEYSANHGNSQGDYILGNIYYGKTKFEKAKEYFYKAASKGNADALNFIGNLFYRGHGEIHNIEKAIEWYKKAAGAGSGDGAFNLANIYQKQNNIESAKYWYKEAEKLYANAVLLFNLKGFDNLKYIIEKNNDLHEYCRVLNQMFILVTQGNQHAQDFLKKMRYVDRRWGEEKLKENKEAISLFQWCIKLAENGDKNAQYCCALWNLVDDRTCMDFLKQSAQNGNIEAQDLLGSYYTDYDILCTVACETNYKLALEYFFKAAAKGSKWAIYHIGCLYNSSNDVLPKNEDRAIEYFTLAANLDNMLAQADLGYLYYNGEKEDSQQGDYWLNKAFRGGYISDSN